LRPRSPIAFKAGKQKGAMILIIAPFFISKAFEPAGGAGLCLLFVF
jgi:hypothetical protein